MCCFIAGEKEKNSRGIGVLPHSGQHHRTEHSGAVRRGLHNVPLFGVYGKYKALPIYD